MGTVVDIDWSQGGKRQYVQEDITGEMILMILMISLCKW
jgi:hypothetical protein